MKTRILASVLVLGSLALASLSTASAQVITSTIYGSVTDPSGAGIPGAKVTVNSTRTGASATATTDPSGEFTLSSLQAGAYSVQIDAEGFKSVRQAAVELASGARTRLAFTLELGTVATAIEVSGAAPLINSINAEQRTNLDTAQVRELPTQRRSWLGLLNLDTGVTTTGGRVAMNGLPPSSFRITVDGTDASSDSEQPSVTMSGNFNFIQGVSLEAVEELNVAKGIASAEIANTMSGNVNVNTKRGTNEVHGSLFYLNDVENTNARNQFLSARPPVVYNQFGGSLGGPVIRNKFFLFGVYEGYQLRGFQQLNGNVPTPEFRAQASAAVPAYSQLFDLYPVPTNPYAPGAVTGFFQGAGSEIARDNHAVVRGDYHLGNSTILSARYTRGRPFRQIPRVVLANFRDWDGKTEVGSFNVTHSRATWVSETRFGFNYNFSRRIDNIYTLGVAGVGGAIGFSTDGEDILRDGSNWTLEQVFGKTIGRHSLRFGGIYGRLRVTRENIETPSVRYANINDFLANRPNFVQVTFGVDNFAILAANYGFFIQDDFRVNRRLMLNLGVRYDYYTVPRERDGRFFNRDAPFGAGPFRDPESIYLPDRNNISPRIGFAYTADSEGKTVLRGGFGMFHSPLPIFGSSIDNVQNAADEPFRSQFSAADVARFGDVLRYPVVNSQVLPLVKGQPGLGGGTVVDPGLRNPFSYQWTLGIQRQLARNLVLETSYVGNRGLNGMMVRQWNRPDRVTGIRPNPNLTTFRYRDSGESSNYHSWQTSLRKRFSHGFTANLNYTWARLMSYTGDADLLLPSTVQDIDNVRADYGPANLDVRHRMVVDFLYELPFARLSAANNSRAGALLLRGWQVNGVMTAQSGSPLNLSQPTGYESSRPDYLGTEVYTGTGRANLQYFNRSAFANVPLNPVSTLPVRPGSVGRNALYGPRWFDLGATLAKSLEFTESLRLQLRVEMFNAFNQTYFSGIQGNINQANFGRFTSTRGARVVQLGARLTF
ncbi:MAG: TonB-dependent receptor [Bryobacteraceae bacterium]|nr:TonB-dependent receptor [Solibacteraceae bacterium]MCL4840491.1 TonB-dependent receptor [Bryobacteraceae bacterium]MCO5350449.1 TonB-dependent receptor [Bryobacteraceae bacterium]